MSTVNVTINFIGGQSQWLNACNLTVQTCIYIPDIQRPGKLSYGYTGFKLSQLFDIATHAIDITHSGRGCKK